MHSNVIELKDYRVTPQYPKLMVSKSEEDNRVFIFTEYSATVIYDEEDPQSIGKVFLCMREQDFIIYEGIVSIHGGIL